MQKQVIDFRASKGITTAQSNEHQRNRSERSREAAQASGNYDLTREHLNFEIVKGGKIQPVDKSHSIPERMAASLVSRGIRDPNEGLPEPRFRTVVNFILGGSRERMHEIAFGNQKVDLSHGADNSHIKRTKDIENWALDMYRFMAERYGEDNIVGFYVHLDETNPHLHCTLLPIDSNNRFAYKKMFAGKDKYEFRAKTLALHDALAEVNRKWGLGRGSSIQATGAKHRSTEEYRRQLDDICTLLSDDIEKQKKVLSDINRECAFASKRVKGLTTMIEHLTIQKEETEKRIDQLRVSIAKGEGDIQTQQKQLLELQRKLDLTNSKLEDKNTKLAEADQKLAALEEERVIISERCSQLRQEAKMYSDDILSKSRSHVVGIMFDSMVTEAKTILPKMPKDQHDLFNDTMLQDLAERSNEIVACATLLFANYIDQAVTFAKTHGGGGGVNQKGWGRDPKEDDRVWAFRCMQQATRMMRPVAKKIKR